MNEYCTVQRHNAPKQMQIMHIQISYWLIPETSNPPGPLQQVSHPSPLFCLLFLFSHFFLGPLPAIQLGRFCRFAIFWAWKTHFVASYNVSYIIRVVSAKLLGVTFCSNLKFDEHVKNILTICSQHCYLFKCLKAQGLPAKQLNLVFFCHCHVSYYLCPACLGWIF